LALRWRSSASAATALTKANIFDEVAPAHCSCPACGGERLSKMGEDITEKLEVIPRSRKVMQTMREKYGQHQPLNRRGDRLVCEGVPLSVSTLADKVGAAAFALMPLYKLVEARVLAATRLHGDDTTLRVMGKAKTDTARLLGLCER